MIDKLASLYHSIVLFNEVAYQNAQQYKWFKTEEGTIFGIDKKELTEKEEGMLEIFTTPFIPEQTPLSNKERLWQELLFQHNQESLSQLKDMIKIPFQFIFFTLTSSPEERSSFSEAVIELFPTNVIVLWEDQLNGVIIIDKDQFNGELLVYEDVISTLTSDFYIDVSFYIGNDITEIEQAHNRFTWGKRCFDLVKKARPDQRVYHVHHALPYLLLTEIPIPLQRHLSDVILANAKEDHELLSTINAFLEANLNVSLAAKKLYLHRNTMQYRVDKFIEKTGIDIKTFPGAVTAYLAILNEQK